MQAGVVSRDFSPDRLRSAQVERRRPRVSSPRPARSEPRPGDSPRPAGECPRRELQREPRRADAPPPLALPPRAPAHEPLAPPLAGQAQPRYRLPVPRSGRPGRLAGHLSATRPVGSRSRPGPLAIRTTIVARRAATPAIRAFAIRRSASVARTAPARIPASPVAAARISAPLVHVNRASGGSGWPRTNSPEVMLRPLSGLMRVMR